MQTLRNEACNLCSLSVGCDTICMMPARQEHAKMMVISEYPSFMDDRNADIMCDKQAGIFWSILTDVLGGDANDVYPTYLVKCKPIDGSKPTAESIKACLPYLIKEIEDVQPDSILCLGETVSKAVCGVTQLQKERGRIHDLKIGTFKTKVIPMYTPYYVSKNDRALKQFAEDVQAAYSAAIGLDNLESKSALVKVTEWAQVEEVVSYILQTGEVCFDFETTGLDTFEEGFRATQISLSFQHGGSWVIPLEHFESPFNANQVKRIMEYLGLWVFGNPDVGKIAHNMKFDMHVAAHYGITVFRGRLDDPMLMHHLLDETNRHGLKELVDTYLNEYSGYESEVTKYKWDEVPLNVLAIYGGYDTDLDFRLKTFFEAWLMEDERLYRIYRNLTIPAMKALWEAEHTGMLIDKELLEDFIDRADDLLNQQDEKLRSYRQVIKYEMYKREQLTEEAIEKLEDKISLEMRKEKPRLYLTTRYRANINDLKSGRVSVYEQINFSSPAQISGLLYSKQGFKYQKTYDKRKREEVGSTGKDVLMELNDPTGFIDDLLLSRSIAKMKSTYLQGMYERLDSKNRIHTSFLLHGTTSGRLSSRDPNLQNLPNMAKLTNPIAIEVVSMVKTAFSVPKGYTMAQLDFSQAELRIIAEFANETNMLQAYADNLDIHALTASKMVHLTIEKFYELAADVIKKHRTNAKAGNFGLIYGMSPDGFVDYAKSNYGVILTYQEAVEFHDIFFDTYPALLDYHELYKAKALKFGYVRTLFGRKRHTPDIDNDNGFKRGMDERVAINSPIQGTAGEFTIFAIALLRNRLDRRVYVVNTVHDSIILYIPDEIVDETLKIAKMTCENLPTLAYFGKELKKVSMVVDMEVSKLNWKSMKSYVPAA